jgi:hypothetical protein
MIATTVLARPARGRLLRGTVGVDARDSSFGRRVTRGRTSVIIWFARAIGCNPAIARSPS